MAGTGKSTIARTVADKFKQNERLGASFSFSAVQGDLSLPIAKFFSTLAFQLANTSRDLRTKISQAVVDHGHIGQLGMRSQWTQLIF